MRRSHHHHQHGHRHHHHRHHASRYGFGPQDDLAYYHGGGMYNDGSYQQYQSHRSGPISAVPQEYNLPGPAGDIGSLGVEGTAGISPDYVRGYTDAQKALLRSPSPTKPSPGGHRKLASSKSAVAPSSQRTTVVTPGTGSKPHRALAPARSQHSPATPGNPRYAWNRGAPQPPAAATPVATAPDQHPGTTIPVEPLSSRSTQKTPREHLNPQRAPKVPPLPLDRLPGRGAPAQDKPSPRQQPLSAGRAVHPHGRVPSARQQSPVKRNQPQQAAQPVAQRQEQQERAAQAIRNDQRLQQEHLVHEVQTMRHQIESLSKNFRSYTDAVTAISQEQGKIRHELSSNQLGHASPRQGATPSPRGRAGSQTPSLQPDGESPRSIHQHRGPAALLPDHSGLESFDRVEASPRQIKLCIGDLIRTGRYQNASSEIQDIKVQLAAGYETLYLIYREYCLRGPTAIDRLNARGYFSMSFLQFYMFVKDFNLTLGAQERPKFNSVFNRCNWHDREPIPASTGPEIESSFSPAEPPAQEHTLHFPEFLEALVRIAHVKFTGPKLAGRVADFLSNNIFPLAPLEDGTKQFRVDLRHPSIVNVFHSHKPHLDRVFKYYANLRRPTLGATGEDTINIKDWATLLKDSKLIGKSLSMQTAFGIFVHSNLSSATLAQMFNHDPELLRSEFDEALARLALVVVPTQEVALAERIRILLEEHILVNAHVAPKKFAREEGSTSPRNGLLHGSPSSTSLTSVNTQVSMTPSQQVALQTSSRQVSASSRPQYQEWRW